MSKVVLISVALSIGVGVLSLQLVKQRKESEATIADLQAQVASLQGQQQRQLPPPPVRSPFIDPSIAPAPAAAITAVIKEVPRTVGVVSSSGVLPAAQLSRDDRMRMFREHRERQRQLMQDPEYREAMRVQTRGNFGRQYPGVIQELGLNAQQADEFFDLLADQQMQATDQMQPIWDMEGVDPTDQAAMQERQRKIAQQAQENQRKNDAAMAARFGQDKLQAWKEYQSSMGMRYELENMRNTLSATGLALSDDLSKPMLKALAQANRAEGSEYSAALLRGAAPTVARVGFNGAVDDSTMDRQLDYMRKRNQRMLEAISPYLSFEQRSAIEKQQEAQVKMQEAQLRLMRAQGRAETNGGYFIEGTGATIVQP